MRTKYDRLFERKNQNILSEHYTKLIDHGGSDSDDEFLTLKRADHDLDSDDDTISTLEAEVAELEPRLIGLAARVSEVRLSAGAGFVVAICGEIMTMPGLPRRPAAEGIGLDAEGRIEGLF